MQGEHDWHLPEIVLSNNVISEQNFHIVSLINNVIMIFHIDTNLIKLSYNPKEPGLRKKIEEALAAIMYSNFATHVFLGCRKQEEKN